MQPIKSYGQKRRWLWFFEMPYYLDNKKVDHFNSSIVFESNYINSVSVSSSHTTCFFNYIIYVVYKISSFHLYPIHLMIFNEGNRYFHLEIGRSHIWCFLYFVSLIFLIYRKIHTKVKRQNWINNMHVTYITRESSICPWTDFSLVSYIFGPVQMGVFVPGREEEAWHASVRGHLYQAVAPIGTNVPASHLFIPGGTTTRYKCDHIYAGGRWSSVQM
jgi:hypothetical protein